MVSTAISAASTLISKGIYDDHGTLHLPSFLRVSTTLARLQLHYLAASTLVFKGIYNKFELLKNTFSAASTLVFKGIYNP